MPDDLPEAWRGAVPAPIMQRETASALGCMCIPSAEITSTDPVVLVVKDASFRSKQQVQAFVLRKPDGIYVLIQPAEMHPTSVYRCGDMLNDVAVVLPIVRGTIPVPGDQVKAVFLRSDAYGGPPHVQKVDVSPTRIGAWYDSWNRAARDAWDEYSSTFRESLPWH